MAAPIAPATLAAIMGDHEAAGLPPPRDTARERAWTEIKAKSPMRPKAEQQDHNHLPLFVAANEPKFI